MERLGETEEFGGLIAGLLVLSGWTVHASRPAIGGGKLWIASRVVDGVEHRVERIAERWSDVAADLMKEAFETLRLGQRDDVQLRLPAAR